MWRSGEHLLWDAHLVKVGALHEMFSRTDPLRAWIEQVEAAFARETLKWSASMQHLLTLAKRIEESRV